MIKELCRLSWEEIKPIRGNLLGVYDVKGNPKLFRVADNYTNRLALGQPLPPQIPSAISGYPQFRGPQDLLHTGGLKDFQVQDVLKMVNSRAFLNRNPMGTGKTVESVIACRELGFKKVLIVAPKPVLGQWVQQFQYWWPRLNGKVNILESGSKLQDGTVWVTNYEKLSMKSFQDVLYGSPWDCIILDEIHYIKNRGSLRSKNAKNLKAIYKWGLSGTPVLKQPDDLYSIFEFLNPEYCCGSYWDFTNFYCDVHLGYYGRTIEGLTKNTEHIDLLRGILGATSCRNEIEVAEGKTIITVPLLMETTQKTLYNNLRKLVLSELPPDLSIPNGAVLATRLLQATSAPELVGGKDSGVKFEWILNYLESSGDNSKIVVYSRFERVLALLRTYLNSKKISCATYTGKVADHARALEKKKFIEDKECRVLLGTIGALGTGVDELQQACNVCVFIDRDFSPEINAQCEDRLRRMGQKYKVMCYYLECVKTLDEKVARVNLTRAEDIRRVLSNE